MTFLQNCNTLLIEVNTKSKIIHTEADYEATLAQIDLIFFAKPGTPEGDELDRLVTMVEMYEEKNYPMDLPPVVEA